MKDTRNRTFFWLFSAFIFIFLVCKATLQAFSHDEAATFFHYIHKENFWPWRAHWDANNHILNSASAWIFYKLFGYDLVWIRLPNVLSFWTYAYFIYRTSCFLKHLVSRYAFQLAMLTPIFLLDFFTLCRGYGMSIAFWWGALFYFVLFFQTNKNRHALKAWLFMALAVWANMSLLNNYLIFIVAYVFYLVFVARSKQLVHYLLLFIPGLLFYIPAVVYTFQMKEKGLLYLGSTDGFMEVTMKTLSLYQFGKSETWFLILLTILMACSVFINLYNKAIFFDVKKYFSFEKFSSLILLGNVIAVILLEKIVHVNYPEDRAGIYLIPLSMSVLFFAFDKLFTWNKKFIYINLLALYFPFYTIANTSFTNTHLWDYLYLTSNLYKQAEKIQNENNEPLIINAYHMYEMSWAYYNLKYGGQLQNMHVQPKPDLNADLIVMPSYYFDTLKTDLYEEVFSQPFNALTLYKRKKFAKKTLYPINITSTNGSGDYEFLDIFSDTLPSHFMDMQVQFSGIFSSKKHPFHAQIVLETKDIHGNVLLYDYIPLHWIKSKWKGEQKKFVRTIPSNKYSQVIIKIYLWNIDKQQFSANIDSLKWFYIENK
ncbi:hypothetical protein FLAV_01960 [Flavobacteriales bacterium]|nr:hypothetical protein FLAV_01960 [Flavobacteriales bacterium]